MLVFFPNIVIRYCGSALISFGSSILGWIQIRIRIGSGSKALMTKNWKKTTAVKKLNFFDKTAIYISLGLHKVHPQKKPSALKRGHPTLQNMNYFFFTFVGHFCPPGFGSGFRIRIRIHWPDWIRIQSGSGSATLIVWNKANISGVRARFFEKTIFIINFEILHPLSSKELSTYYYYNHYFLFKRNYRENKCSVYP